MNKTFNQSKDEIAKLCQYFATNHQEFLSPGVKEAHVRQSLIDPLFEALGWDVRNTARVAPQYREVIPEDSLDVEGQQKAPDYCFRVGTLPKFYAEAKKCGINISADPGPAYQLRRYGWSAKVALSILTDFEELGIYDCTIRPRPRDKASYARIQYFHFEEYPDRWHELWDVFSREAVWSGDFDKYAASKRKRGTSEVDVEFLKEIEGWRDALARNIALRNKDLSPDDLNAAVQRTIDRVVFLRMAEDRGIESYEQLLKLCERPNIYTRFINDLCFRADEKYNSGLFHFHKEKGISEAPDQITPKLTVDDKVFKPILQNLYFAYGSPYHFGVLPVEILGTVYERFLGKVIRLTAGHHAKIEEKPEVRKAGGVYYTPAYIVDYIVKHTVGTQIEGKSPKQLAGVQKKDPFRVLDMACGSGSFLLGAYQCLLDHCLKWYMEHTPKKYKKAVYKDARNDQWRLTIPEKKRILTTHIFGVDIDPQAVEVSKLSLLLKVLEGETDQTIGQQMQLFHERALPNLADNIKCGNSLIGPDYFSGNLVVDPNEMRRINSFDWKRGFPDAIKTGGFDCVIGNPPYGANLTKFEFDYLKKKYISAEYQIDTYPLFLEKGFSCIKDMAYLGMIIPSAWVLSKFNKNLRNLISSYKINNIVVTPKRTFLDAVVETLILICQKSEFIDSMINIERWDKKEQKHYHLSQLKIKDDELFEFKIYSDPDVLNLLDKIKAKSYPLSNIASAVWGVKIYQKGKGKPKQNGSESKAKAFHSEKKLKDSHKPLIGGKNINRFALSWDNTYVDYGDWLAEPRSPEWFEGPKIIIREVTSNGVIQATFTSDDFVFSNSVDGIKLTQCNLEKYYFLLGIINSKLISFFNLYSSANAFKGAFPKVLIKDILNFPIIDINLKREDEKSQYDHLVTLVQHMLNLHKTLAAVRDTGTREQLQRQIDAVDKKIERLVYDLYGLTNEEIAIVEGDNP